MVDTPPDTPSDLARERARRQGWLPWLFGALAVVVVLGVLVGINWVQSDLGGETDDLLAANGFGALDVDFDGREAEVTGVVGSDADRARVVELIHSVDDVRDVDVSGLVIRAASEPEPAAAPATTAVPTTAAPTTAAPATTATPTTAALEPASFRLSVDADGVVTVAGAVPDDATADALVTAVGEVYGGANVVDELDRTSAPAPWPADLPDAVRAVGLARDGGLDVRDGEATVTGIVSDDDRPAVLDGVRAALGDGVTVIDAMTSDADAASDAIEAALEGVGDASVLFATGSAEISPEGSAVLDDIAGILAEAPDVRFEVGGHTDSDGSDQLNLQLSQARADAVVTYLVGQGVAADRLEAVGYGEAEPVADNTTPEGRAQNRRIVFDILS